MKILSALALLALAAMPGAAQPRGGLDGLYLQMRFAFGNFNPVHWWFLPDGRYMKHVPLGGLAQAEFEPSCQKMADVCGTYRIEGDKLALTPRKGAPTAVAFKRRPDGNLDIEGLFARKVPRFPAGAKLAGKYGRMGGASGGGVVIGSASTYAFRPDGTYTTAAVASMAAPVAAAGTTGNGAGTYRLDGNTLELTGNGQTTRHVAYPYDMGNGEVWLIVDGAIYKPVR